MQELSADAVITQTHMTGGQCFQENAGVSQEAAIYTTVTALSASHVVMSHLLPCCPGPSAGLQPDWALLTHRPRPVTQHLEHQVSACSVERAVPFWLLEPVSRQYLQLDALNGISLFLCVTCIEGDLAPYAYALAIHVLSYPCTQLQGAQEQTVPGACSRWQLRC